MLKATIYNLSVWREKCLNAEAAFTLWRYVRMNKVAHRNETFQNLVSCISPENVPPKEGVGKFNR